MLIKFLQLNKKSGVKNLLTASKRTYNPYSITTYDWQLTVGCWGPNGTAGWNWSGNCLEPGSPPGTSREVLAAKSCEAILFMLQNEILIDSFFFCISERRFTLRSVLEVWDPVFLVATAFKILDIICSIKSILSRVHVIQVSHKKKGICTGRSTWERCWVWWSPWPILTVSKTKVRAPWPTWLLWVSEVAFEATVVDKIQSAFSHLGNDREGYILISYEYIKTLCY